MTANPLPPSPPSSDTKLAILDDLWRRGVKVPVERLIDLHRLDADEVQAGYTAGASGAPEPNTAASRAFWHGWRVGRQDAGHAELDIAARELARRVAWWSERSRKSKGSRSSRYADLERALQAGEAI